MINHFFYLDESESESDVTDQQPIEATDDSNILYLFYTYSK